MADRAITFDFHNTLVHCDPWFELEIRTLPTAFLNWLGGHSPARAHARSGNALEAEYRRLRTAIIRHGHELTAEQSLKIVFSQAGLLIDDAEIAQGVAELMRAALAHAEPVEGAIETVHAIGDAGVRLGIVSSAVYDPFLHWALAQFGISARFEVVVTSASSGFYKSRPEIYWETLGLLSSSANKSVHVGDSVRFDVEGAARAGMRTVLLDRARTADTPVRPDLTLTSLVGAAPGLLDLLTRDVA